MEITLRRDTFLKALQKVQGIVEKRNTMPILSNVLMEASGDTLFVTATDLEVGMKSSYPVDVIREGKITVAAKKLYEIIKELPDQEISFSTRENDWIDIRCGKAQFNIVGLSPDEFPYFPKVGEYSFLEVPNSVLREMIDQTSYAICSDETKYNLNGIFVKAGDKDGQPFLRMVATDGHRLSVVERPLAGKAAADLQKGAIFPRKGIYELRKMTEEEEGGLQLGMMDNSAVVKKGNSVVVMRLVDGEFPDYTRVIPQHNDKSVRIGREDLLHSLKRMSILSSEKFKGIKLEVGTGTMEISSSNPEFGEAREELTIDYAGVQIMARFNARYLIDVLAVLPEPQVELQLKDEMSPAIVLSVGQEGFLAVVMPMRL